jgi:hypothetical protein
LTQPTPAHALGTFLLFVVWLPFVSAGPAIGQAACEPGGEITCEPALTNLVHLPMISAGVGGGPIPTGPTFNVRVAHVDGQGGCVDALPPATGQLCLSRGYFPAIESDNPSHIVFGGRQGDGADAAWSGDPDDFDLVAPALTIDDADGVTLQVSGYGGSAGPFVTAGPPYTVIKLEYDAAVLASMGAAPFQDQAEFQGYLQDMLKEGQQFSVEFPGSYPFLNRTATASFSASGCGQSSAGWYPQYWLVNIIATQSPFFVVQGGKFTSTPLDSCMLGFRYVRIADLLTLPEAQDLRDRVNARRGGPVTTFQWFTDSQNTVYAFWGFAAGGLAYYGYQALNAPVLRPAMILIIPQEFYDVTCNTVNGIKACLVTEGDPNH